MGGQDERELMTYPSNHPPTLSSKDYQEYVRRDPYVDQSRINEALIKRIIAKGGDVVEVKDGKLFVNGAAQKEEAYIAEGPEYVWGPRQVPDGMYMVRLFPPTHPPTHPPTYLLTYSRIRT